MELKRCEPTQQDGSREEWRRQTLCDKLDNNMVKKKSAKLHLPLKRSSRKSQKTLM